MHQVTRRSVIALAIFACALASCGGDDSTAHVTTSYFAPDSLGEVARVSAFVIEGRVISDPTVHDVPPENVPPPDAAGENSPSPAVFAYEVVNVSVTRVFGRPGNPAAPSVGETIVVGVPVQGEDAPSTLSEDDQREITRPGETFDSEHEEDGIFFLTEWRPLGSGAAGYEAMGAAVFTNDGQAEVRAVFGALRGTSVTRIDAVSVAEKS